MSEFTTYPREDLYESTLQSDIGSSDTLIVVSDAVQFSLLSGSCYAHLDYDNPDKYEIVSITALSVDKKTWTVTRAAAPVYEGGTATPYSHTSGAKVLITNSWKLFSDIKDVLATKADIAGETFTGLIQFSGIDHAGLKLLNLTTAQREALTPSDGMIVFDTTIGENYQYLAGAWYAVAAGSTQPNASETVAGKVELATDAEIDAGTDVGGTGASLVPTPSQLNPNNLGNAKTSLADADLIAISDSADGNAIKKVTIANTGFIKKTLLSAKGSIISASAASTPAEETAGADNTVLGYLAAGTNGLQKTQRARYLEVDTTGASIAQLTTSYQTLKTFTIPANTLGTDNLVEVDLSEVITTAHASYNATIQLVYGSTVVDTIELQEYGLGSVTGGSSLYVPQNVKLYLQGNASVSSQTGFMIGINSTQVFAETPAVAAEDSTASQDLTIKVKTSNNTGTRVFSYKKAIVSVIPA